MLMISDEKLMTISITINNQLYEIQVPPFESLSNVLRDHLTLTGTKTSCGIGRCGACSVLVDGELSNACLIMAYQVEGKSITTIEGLKQYSLDEVQEAFLKEGGFQCGYCTSGMILAVKTLLDRNPSPQEADIKEALAGNLCRCTGYGGILRAVQYLIDEKKQKEGIALGTNSLCN
ncbi:MAG: (2Fe-2S)-binding protein [Lysinibacillus sp.]